VQVERTNVYDAWFAAAMEGAAAGGKQQKQAVALKNRETETSGKINNRNATCMYCHCEVLSIS
jgi:hypothetical protein